MINTDAHSAALLSFADGVAAMALGTRPRWKFGVVDGGRNRWTDRTLRPALNLKIVGKDEP